MFATATICGRAGAAPRQLNTNSGKVVAKIPVYVNQPNKILDDKPGYIFHLYVYEAQAIRAIELIKPGSKITATGRLNFGEYTDENGEIRYETRIDFAQILDYGYVSNSTETGEKEIKENRYEEPKPNLTKKKPTNPATA